MPKCHCAKPGMLIMELPKKQMSENDCVQKAPPVKPPTRCQTERPEDRPPGREPSHEKSKGTGAAAGSSHNQAEKKQNRNHILWRCVHAWSMGVGDPWTGVTCRNGTTNHTNDRHVPSPSVSTVPLLCVLCPALSCSLCAVQSSPQQRTMSTVPFYPTADECSDSLKT